MSVIDQFNERNHPSVSILYLLFCEHGVYQAEMNITSAAEVIPHEIDKTNNFRRLLVIQEITIQ